MPSAKPKPSFEELYRELEEKVALLEQGGLSLDDSLAAYEAAVGLAQKCQQQVLCINLAVAELTRQRLSGNQTFLRFLRVFVEIHVPS